MSELRDRQAAPPLVLLADDDREIALAASLRLRAAGYQVDQTHDGAAALERIHERRPDLLILDIRMPRLDGFEVLSRLRADEATSSLPVIMLSANAAEKARARALELGARFFISKPYNGRVLLQAAQAVLKTDQPTSDTGGSR
jgi:DNA-binding response OmpR family regulator